MVWRLVLVGMVLATVVGCEGMPDAQGIRRFRAKVDRITPEGTVVLQSGQEVPLAGVRMRGVDETQEPELINVINEIVVRRSRRVLVEHHEEMDTAVVLYTQGVYHMPQYWLPVTMMNRVLKPTTTGTVNELVLVMAAATYDPALGVMSDESAERCRRAAEKAELAMWERYRYRPLNEYVDGDGQLYTDVHGYRARIATGDVAERDACLAKSALRARE